MTVLALIPARDGSKGIPGKNLAVIGGKPLIGWSITAAQASGVVDRILVSTDSRTIADVAIAYGAEAPWLRPAELSTDDALVLAVARHALNEFERTDAADWVILLQPTSPLRSHDDIRNALELAQQRNAQSVIGVTATHIHPAWLFTIDESGELNRHVSAPASTQRQQRASYYVPNGAIYIVKAEVLRGGGSWYDAGALAYVMPAERSLDIDTPWDLRLAELILNSES
jgi:CMP-N,N'-diacetyllegionaminic acid synthase